MRFGSQEWLQAAVAALDEAAGLVARHHPAAATIARMPPLVGRSVPEIGVRETVAAK